MALSLQELLTGKASGRSIAEAVVDAAHREGSNRRAEHYAFFEDNTEPAELPAKADRALEQAKVDAKPSQIFSELNGFSVELNDAEAGQLRDVPAIHSVELDQPLPLSPPVEVKPVSSTGKANAAIAAPSESNALDQEVRLEDVLVAEAADNSASESTTQTALNPSALPIYGNGRASSGEVLPYGVRAVWGGKDISSQGNAGKGTYAFVIDSGVLDTTGDLLVNWSTRPGPRAGSAARALSPMAMAMAPM